MKQKPIFWVDIPDPSAGPDGEWINVGSFDTRDKAEQYLEERWGIGQEYADLFISVGEM